MAGLIAGLLGGPVERKDVGFPENWLEAFGTPSKTGIRVTADAALRCTTALACTQAIACGVAMLPLKVYRPLASGRGREEARDTRLFRLLDLAPNEWQTTLEFIETLLVHTVLTGNGYAFINRVRGEVRELIPIMPAHARVEQNDDYSLAYTVSLKSGGEAKIARQDMLHLRGPSWNAYSGLDAIGMAREAIGLALATEETHSRLHSNGVRASGVLSTEQTIGPDQIKQLREQWAEAHVGLANTMKPIVLGGGLNWQAISLSGVDAQHVETRKFQIEEICRAMGVFPQMVGHSDKTATFASAEAFFLAHVIYTLSRWTRRIEKRFMRDLLTPDQIKEGLFIKFQLQALLRGDNKTRAEFYNALITLGVMTRNEARLLEELNPLDGLDEPLTPLNLGVGAAPETDEGQRFMSVLAQEVARIVAAENHI